MKTADEARKLFTELAHPEEFRRLNAAQELDRLGYLDGNSDLGQVDDPAQDAVNWRESFTDEPLSFPGGYAALDRALADWMAPIRRAAATALGLTLDQTALLPLKKLLRDGDSSVRLAAIFALARLGTDEASDQLRLLLDDPFETRRIQIVRALGESDNEASLSLLWRTLRSVDESVRVESVRALGIQARLPGSARGDEPLTDSIEYWLIGALSDMSVQVRAAAVAELRAFNTPTCVIALNAMLGDEDEAICASAGRILGQFGVEPTAELACEALNRETGRLRASAARRLSILADPLTAATLCGALGDTDEAVRREAAVALERMRQPETLELLIEALDSPYAQIRRGAVIRMGRRGQADAIPHLHAILEQNQALSFAAAESLARLNPPEAMPHLLRWLEDEHDWWRVGAIEVFNSLGWRGALPVLRRRLRTFGGEPDPNVRQRIREVIDHIESISRDRSELPVVALNQVADLANLPVASEGDL